MFFSEMSLEQVTLHCYNSLMLAIALNPWSPLLIINLNCTIWFPMIDQVTQWPREKVIHLTQICRLTWPGFNTGKDCCVCTTPAIGSSTLLCRSQLTCTTATHLPEIPCKIHQHSCQNIHDIVAANDNDFYSHFNDKLLHKKYLYSPANYPSQIDACCSMN